MLSLLRHTVVAFFLVGVGALSAAAAPPVLIGEVDVDAPVEKVWQAWTTPGGLATFFAPDAEISLEPGGIYEVYIVPDAPDGQRGSEGTEVIAVEPNKLLSFEWAMPPSLPAVRPHLTVVTLIFNEREAGGTRLQLVHSGFGSGGEWDQALAYFTSAWNAVLSSLAHSFKHGPISPQRFKEAAEANGGMPPWVRSDIVRPVGEG